MATRQSSGRLRFYGAAGVVTGSCYHLTLDGVSFLVDCGLFQGNKTLRELNYQPFPFDPARLDFVLLTHAHIDHSGLLPKLVRRGFKGPVYATDATRDLLGFMLPDSGYIQETEVQRLNERNRRRGRRPVEPIYRRVDAERSVRQIRGRPLDAWFSPVAGVRARFWNAGHILGAASIELELAGAGREGAPLRLLFSGDIGPQEKAFHEQPEAPVDLDYLIVEGTYGDREREDVTVEQRRELLRREIAEALAAGGNLLIPAFAVERTQELLNDIARLMAEGRLPQARVFLDSPLAIKATEVFESYAGELRDLGDPGVPGDPGATPFRGTGFSFTPRAEQSRRIGRITEGAIIIAASGMCDAGRIRHHLKHNLWRRGATVLFVGYQAPGTLGSILLGGARTVRIHGEEIAVRARLRRLDAYSAHADQGELVEWVRRRLPVAQAVFLTHGEPAALRALKQCLAEAGLERRKLIIPKLDEEVELAASGKVRLVAEAARAEPEKIADLDWHNAYAGLLVELSERLQALPDDAAREALLRDLQRRVAHD